MDNTIFYITIIIGILFLVLIFLQIWIFYPSFHDAINVAVLIITAIFIGWQSWNTNKILEKGMLPSIEVSVLDGYPKTRFQFINSSNIPGKAWLSINIKIDGNEIKGDEKLRLLGKSENLIGKKGFYISSIQTEDYARITSSEYFGELISEYYEGDKEIEIILNIDVSSSLNEKHRFPFQRKIYKFDRSKKQWIESSWGMPDPIHPKLNTTPI